MSINKKIVVIGGGTGTSTLLKGLKKYPLDLSVVVSTADDGGSTGKLRQQFGVLPPGDMRQCLAALSQKPKLAEEFNHRYETGKLRGHAVGNLILANLEKRYGIEATLEIVGKSLEIKGQVLPVTLKPTTLYAVLENGKVIKGEHNIDEPKVSLKFKIKDLRLKPNGPANPKALKALKSANVIIFGPGDLFTSTLPNLLVSGIKEAVSKSSAKKILITNIMTKSGQTDEFKASDFVKVLEKYLGSKIDLVLANNQNPNLNVLKKYSNEKGQPVEIDAKVLAKLGVEFVAENLLSNKVYDRKASDKLKRSFLRHDSEKLSKLIWELI